jgi:hypothetical protein
LWPFSLLSTETNFTGYEVVNRDLEGDWAIISGEMDPISRADALKIVSKWERQNQTISVFGFSPAIALTSKRGKIAMCLDECIELRLADETALRIFTPGAVFSSVGPEDIPSESVRLLPKFEHGIRVDFQDQHAQWYLLA